MKSLKNHEQQSTPPVMQAASDELCEFLRAHGFRPAFFDYSTCTLHLSRHPDGSPAEVHLVDSLPDDVVVIRACGRAVALKSTLRAGFERHGYYFTKAAAQRAIQEWA
jgi:hypothetical protein